MPGPWERYQRTEPAEESGPWQRYTQKPAESKPIPATHPVERFAEGAWKNVDPVAAVESAAQITASPLESLKAIGQAQGQRLTAAQKAWESGDYVSAARHAIEYALPVFGPVMGSAGDKMAEGDIAGGLGETAGAALSIFGPRAVPKGSPVAIAKAAGKELLVRGVSKATGVPRPVVEAAGSVGRDIARDVMSEARRRVVDEVLPPNPATAAKPAAIESAQVPREQLPPAPRRELPARPKPAPTQPGAIAPKREPVSHAQEPVGSPRVPLEETFSDPAMRERVRLAQEKMMARKRAMVKWDAVPARTEKTVGEMRAADAEEKALQVKHAQPPNGPVGSELVFYHGSPGELNSLRPGSMMPDDPVWASGYTTRMKGGIGPEEFTGKVHKISVSPNNPMVIEGSLHDAEQALLDAAKKSGQSFTGLKGAAEIVRTETGHDYILAKHKGRIVGAISLVESPVKELLSPLEVLKKADPNKIPQNLSEIIKRAELANAEEKALQKKPATAERPAVTERPASQPEVLAARLDEVVDSTTRARLADKLTPEQMAQAEEMAAAMGQRPSLGKGVVDDAKVGAEIEAKNRTAQAQKMAEKLKEHGITSDMAARMNAQQWRQVQYAAGADPKSATTHLEKPPSARTQAEALDALRKMEKPARRKAKISGKPAPEPMPAKSRTEVEAEAVAADRAMESAMESRRAGIFEEYQKAGKTESDVTREMMDIEGNLSDAGASIEYKPGQENKWYRGDVKPEQVAQWQGRLSDLYAVKQKLKANTGSPQKPKSGARAEAEAMDAARKAETATTVGTYSGMNESLYMRLSATESPEQFIATSRSAGLEVAGPKPPNPEMGTDGGAFLVRDPKTGKAWLFGASRKGRYGQHRTAINEALWTDHNIASMGGKVD